MAKRKSTRNVPVKNLSSEKTGRKRGRDDNVTSSSQQMPLKKRGKTVKSTTTSSTEPSEEKFKSRMSPSSLFLFINSGLSEDQVRDINEIGFGGLLQVSTDKIPGRLANWLVRNFDPRQCSLMNGQLKLEDVDVHLATGLPIGPLEVKEASKDCKDQSFLKLKKNWLEQFGDVNEVSRTALVEKLKSQRGGGEDFKRNFIVLVMSTFLMGTNSNTVSARILSCLGDLSRVRRYNWCVFTLRHLSLSVISWHKNKEKGKYYKGPIMVLVYIYLDRVVQRWRSVNRVFPTLSGWTKAEISSRVAIEEKDGFGTGAVHERMAHVLPVYEDEVGGSSPVLEDADESHKVVMDKLKKVALDFAKSYTSLSIAVNEAKAVNSNCEFVQYMSSVSKGISDGYRYLGQMDISNDDNDDNFDVVIHELDKSFGAPSSSYRERMEKRQGGSDDMDQEFEQYTPKIPSPEPRPTIHSCPNNPAIDFKLTSCRARSEPTNSRRQQSDELDKAFCVTAKDSTERKRQWESDAISVSESIPTDPTSSKRQKVAGRTPTNELLSSPTKELPDTTVELDPTVELFCNVDNDVVISHFDTTKMSSPEASPTIPSIPVNPGTAEIIRSYSPKRKIAEASSLYKSSYVLQNSQMFTWMPQAAVCLADYVFDRLDLSEQLYVSPNYTLTRSELQTLMVGAKVSENVIGVWCDFLNHQDKSSQRGLPSRLFLTKKTRVDPHFIYADLEFVFVPVVLPKPILFAINIQESVIEVVCACPQLAASDYEASLFDVLQLVDVHLPKNVLPVSKIGEFDIRTVRPKTNIGHRQELGHYMMRFMETYQGKQLLKNCKVINGDILFRATVRICYLILTFEENSKKDKVLQASGSSDVTTRVEDVLEAIRKVDAGGKKVHAVVKTDKKTDKELLDYVFRKFRAGSEEQYEVLVDTQWMQVTRDSLQSLKYPSWLFDVVIDAIGIQATLDNDKVIYFPTSIKELKRTTFPSNYIKLDYMPKSAENVERVFFPLLSTVGVKHWYCCIADLKASTCSILDSAPGRRAAQRSKLAKQVVNHALELIVRDKPGFEKLLAIKDFEFKNIPVARQNNGSDCGVFVIKWLFSLQDEKQWTVDKNFEDLDDYRMSLLLSLLKWDQNKKVLSL